MYKLRKRFTEIKNFVYQCPFLENFCVEFDDGFAETVIVSEGILAKLSFESSSDVAVEENICGEVSIQRHDIYRIKLSQNAVSENDRANLFEFIENFQGWVDYSHYIGSTVTITESERGKVWADSFREDSKTNDDYWFIVQLHVADVQTMRKHNYDY